MNAIPRRALLLDVGGAPMIRRTVEKLLEFGPVQTVVVTGRGAADIERRSPACRSPSFTTRTMNTASRPRSPPA